MTDMEMPVSARQDTENSIVIEDSRGEKICELIDDECVTETMIDRADAIVTALNDSLTLRETTAQHECSKMNGVTQ